MELSFIYVQGANQAMLDAVNLAHCISSSDLSSASFLRAALNSYESEMCLRTAQKVRASRQAAEQVHSGSPFSNDRLSSRKLTPEFLAALTSAGVSLSKLSPEEVFTLDERVALVMGTFSQSRTSLNVQPSKS